MLSRFSHYRAQDRARAEYRGRAQLTMIVPPSRSSDTQGNLMVKRPPMLAPRAIGVGQGFG
jgi:hypothetical protein